MAGKLLPLLNAGLIFLATGCSPYKGAFDAGDTALGGLAGAAAGGGIGAAIGAGISDGDIGKSAALGAGIGLAAGAVGVAAYGGSPR